VARKDGGNERARVWFAFIFYFEAKPLSLSRGLLSHHWEPRFKTSRLVHNNSYIRDHYAWMALEQTKKMVLDSSDIHWQSTHDTLHNNNTGSYNTSTRDSSLRSHHVKKLCGVLPRSPARSAPKHLPHHSCPCCQDQEENNEHLRNFEAHITTERNTWTQVIESMPESPRGSMPTMGMGQGAGSLPTESSDFSPKYQYSTKRPSPMGMSEKQLRQCRRRQQR
jgi:hypothetical protein